MSTTIFFPLYTFPLTSQALIETEMNQFMEVTILIKTHYQLMEHGVEFHLPMSAPRQRLLIDSETINYRRLSPRRILLLR